MAGSVTWYEILGVLPGASRDDIRDAYQARASQLGPDRISGAPSKVVAAASRAIELLDRAWRILGDPAERERYDEQAGLRQPGSGLTRAEPVPSQPRLNVSQAGGALTTDSALLLGGLDALVDWLAPHPGLSRRVVVPDVRGLFSSQCLGIVAKAGLHINVIRLTEHPLPVEGLVVDQSPPPGAKVRRSSTLTVQVWHPRQPQGFA